MAVYTFECGGCGVKVDKVFGMLEVGKRRKLKCASCGGKLARVYGRPEVRPDTWSEPRELAHLYNLGDDPEGPHPTFETRTEERKYREAHERKYGWS